MVILKIYQEGRLLMKHYVIKHLTLLKVQDMMDNKEVFLQLLVSFLIKSLLVPLLLQEVKQVADELHKPIIKK